MKVGSYLIVSLTNDTVCMYICNFIIHSGINIWLNYIQRLAILNSAAIRMGCSLKYTKIHFLCIYSLFIWWLHFKFFLQEFLSFQIITKLTHILTFSVYLRLYPILGNRWICFCGLWFLCLLVCFSYLCLFLLHNLSNPGEFRFFVFT